MDQNTLTNQELRRYKRQILQPDFGEDGQEKLKNSAAIVIGAGGMGNAALQYLASAGIGEIGICDNSIVEESDFQNQSIFKSIDLGKHKTIVAKANLEAFNSFNNYSIFNIYISRENAEEICQKFNLIIDLANESKISELLDEASFKLNIPLIHASLRNNKYALTVLNYKNGPRLHDFLSLNPDFKSSSIFSETSFGASDGIAGSLVALEAIKILSGVGEVLSGRSLTIDPINLKFEFNKIK